METVKIREWRKEARGEGEMGEGTISIMSYTEHSFHTVGWLTILSGYAAIHEP